MVIEVDGQPEPLAPKLDGFEPARRARGHD
jgi:hypothetical protein